MRLSLVFPSWAGEFGLFKEAARKVSTFPPLNLCIVGAVAERAGWEVQLIDGHIEGLDLNEIVDRVAGFDPDLIGLTAATPFFRNALAAAKALKDSLDRPVIMGGTHVSIMKEKAFADELDYLFIGECESTFGEFLGQFASGKRNPAIPGIMSRRGGKILFSGEPRPLDDLDRAPPPARHLLPNHKYFLGSMQGKKRYTSVQMTRGCPFSCVFCACDLYGKKCRRRGIDSVMRELELVIGRYKAEHIYFVDDTLTLNRQYILDLCDAVESSGLKFTFEGSTRADLVDEKLIGRLRDIGLIRLSFGLETADPEVRRIIRKGVLLESYGPANRLCKRHGIETINSAMIGLPGDTRESIKRTVDFLCRERELHHVTLNIAMPYPGTEMYDMAERGLHGLRLLEHDYSRYQRYGSAVMSVNEISPDELIDLQQRALIRIYSSWWRIIPIIKRFGLGTVIRTGCAAMSAVLKKKCTRIMSRSASG